MTTLFDAVKKYDNGTETENGCAAYKSTLSACLDLFFNACSCRRDPAQAGSLVLDAYKEDKLACLRLLFYIRDIRGGQGEREVFRAGMKEIIKFAPCDVTHLMKLVPEFGRWDDLFALYGIDKLIDTEIKLVVLDQTGKDLIAWHEDKPYDISLIWKWLPSENASSKSTSALAKKIRKEIFGLDSKSYRKQLSKMRKILKIVERDISAKEYKNINYSNLPSKAAQKYKQAFIRNDCVRYSEYIEKLTNAVRSGTNDVKINTATLYPYDILRPLVNAACSYRDIDVGENEIKLLDATWKSQKDYFSGSASHENWLTVADVSGSMTCAKMLPMCASVSLAMYTAEHNTGIFADKFITFSARPEFVQIDKNWTIQQKVKHIMSSDWGMNTDLEAVFELILSAARRYNVHPKDMPNHLLIISDMQFDECTRGTALDTIRQKYALYGYELPKVIFWNVAGNYKANVPAMKNDNGVILFSGYKPGMFEQMVSGTTPLEFMLSVVNSERYSIIKVNE